jgi:hypothetical protein
MPAVTSSAVESSSKLLLGTFATGTKSGPQPAISGVTAAAVADLRNLLLSIRILCGSGFSRDSFFHCTLFEKILGIFKQRIFVGFLRFILTKQRCKLTLCTRCFRSLSRVKNLRARLEPLTEIETLFLEYFFGVVLGALFRDGGLMEFAHAAHVQVDRTLRAFILPRDR